MGLVTLMPDISILSRLFFNCGVWGTDSAHNWTTPRDEQRR